MPKSVVTGISPKEGPPGTKVTIRGENLGVSQADFLGVAICGRNCTMTAEWQSPSKIICRTSYGEGTGDIIVMTASGGTGTSTVKFTGHHPKQVGPNEVSLTWVDESNYIDKRLDRSQKTQYHMRTDPLGINVDDSNTSDVDSSYAHMFQKGSHDPTDENFVPTWFLLKNHRETPFQKLKEGHAYMKKRANRNSNNVPLNHVKDSLPVFFEVNDTLSAIHHKMQKDLDRKGNENITDEVEQLLNEASKNANDLFKTVLTCKDRADSIRNTLNVLQRFKFLFHLPLNIDRNVQKGDYGVVINDYEKAKSLFSHTEFAIFKKVYKVVEAKIEEFREQLTQEVQQLPLSLTRQKTLIRFLIGLGWDGGDPAWECLYHQHEWIQNQMLQCKDKYLDQAKSLGAGEEEKFMFICEEYHTELTRIATDQFPEHWHLWEHYASGVILSETGEKSAQVEKLKNAAARHAKDMKGLFRDTIILLVNLLRAAFLPSSLAVDEDGDEANRSERSSYGMWPEDRAISAEALAECVRCCRETHQEIASLNLPSGLLDPLKVVIQDLRVLCLSNFLQEAAEEIRNLHTKETWDVEEGGVTSLPSSYNEIISKLFLFISDVQSSLPGEENIFTRASFQTRLSHLTSTLFVSFPEAIERACLPEETSDFKSREVASAKRLVIGLSNLDYAKTFIFPPLLERLRSQNFPDLQRTLQVADESWLKVRNNIFDVYCEQRVDPLVAVLEPGMYTGNFSWDDCAIPISVRSYIKVAIMKIITLHSEVFDISPPLIKDVMNEVIRCTAEEILRLMECVTVWSPNGALQARLDTEALRECTKVFATSQSESFFDEALATLPKENGKYDSKLLEQLKEDFKSGMMFQMRCFQS